MYVKHFCLVLVVFVVQNQAGPASPVDDHPLAKVMQDFLNLFVKLLGSFFRHENVPEECKLEFKAPEPLPQEVGEKIRACTAKYVDQANEILKDVPENMKKRVDDFITGNFPVTNIKEIFELVRSSKEMGHLIHQTTKTIADKNTMATMLKCSIPLFKHISDNFQKNVANFDNCVAKANS